MATRKAPRKYNIKTARQLCATEECKALFDEVKPMLPVLPAAPFKYIPKIQELLDYNGVHTVNQDGENALHIAVDLQPEAILPLIAAGADVNSMNEIGFTPLHKAAYYNKLQAISLLLASGAERRSGIDVSQDVLGQGSFGKVFIGVYYPEEGGELPSAVKVIPRDKFDENEYLHHVKLSQYPDCNQYVACIYKLFGEKETGDSENLYLALELIRGKELLDVVFRRQLSLEVYEDMFKQLLKGMAYIHSKDIAHLDIKLENIMAQEDTQMNNWHFKFIDFGFACDPDTCLDSSSTIHGSTFLTPPEYYNPDLGSASAQSVDIWALGATFLETLLGKKKILKRLDDLQLDGASVSNNDPDTWNIADELLATGVFDRSDDVWHLVEGPISAMMQMSPKKRMTAQQVLDKYFRRLSNKDEMSGAKRSTKRSRDMKKGGGRRRSVRRR